MVCRFALLFRPTRVIHVVTAVITAKGENSMTSNTEQTETPVTASIETKPTQKARGSARVAHVAPKKGKASKRATPSKKTPKPAPKAKPARPGKAGKEKGVREGSKTETILELLKRPGGVTSKELMKATGWQPHSVRGFLSGTVGKKMGLTVTSAKGEDGERTYSVEV
jgi:hypothetical protein